MERQAVKQCKTAIRLYLDLNHADPDGTISNHVRRENELESERKAGELYRAGRAGLVFPGGGSIHTKLHYFDSAFSLSPGTVGKYGAGRIDIASGTVSRV